MALTIEDGSIVENADSYATLAEADARATAIGNLTWADLDALEVREPALRQAFNYLNTRWDASWKGIRVRSIDASSGDGLTADDIFFTAPNLIGSTTSDLSVFDGPEKVRVSGADDAANNADFTIDTNTPPTANLITLVEQTIVTAAAGPDIGLAGFFPFQAGSWPRRDARDPDGRLQDFEKIPAEIVIANIEYAFIAATSSLTLTPTPVVDSSGRALTKLEQGVGPLRQVKEWADGTIQPIAIRPYPQADLWVRRWIKAAGGGVIR